MNKHYMWTFIFCFSFVSFVAAETNIHQDNILNAIKHNSGDAIKQSLLAIVQEGQVDKSPESILLKAIMTGTAEEIKQALEPVVNQGKNDIAPVTWAVLLRKPDAVKTLLDYGAIIDPVVFQYACGDFKTMLEIVKSGADVSVSMHDYMCWGLGNAYSNQDAFELVQELIKRGFNINDAWNQDYTHSLFRAGNERVLKLFLEAGANPNQTITSNKIAETPLLLAVCKTNKQAVEILLDAGANINQKGRALINANKELTPLSHAALSNQTAIVELLLERGASL